MKTLNSFPDLGRHFQLMKINYLLLGLNPDGGMIPLSIVNAVEKGNLTDAIIAIKDMIKDNRRYIVELLGFELVEMIEKI